MEEASVPEKPLPYGEDASFPCLCTPPGAGFPQDWRGRPAEGRALPRTCRCRAQFWAPWGQMGRCHPALKVPAPGGAEQLAGSPRKGTSRTAGAHLPGGEGGVTFSRALRAVQEGLAGSGSRGGQDQRWGLAGNNCTRSGLGGRCQRVGEMGVGGGEEGRLGRAWASLLSPPSFLAPCPAPRTPSGLCLSSSHGAVCSLPGLSAVRIAAALRGGCVLLSWSGVT